MSHCEPGGQWLRWGLVSGWLPIPGDQLHDGGTGSLKIGTVHNHDYIIKFKNVFTSFHFLTETAKKRQ